ncbi:MAG: helix-turn-helix domain-containing protein [Nitrospiraceae bacterium]|nr:helix-turn-helix domain-containing protein [Nitrospiraceae bacterium]
MKDFAALLREVLDQEGWTQIRLANALGVSRQYVSSLCKGKATPNRGKQKEIAHALGVAPSRLTPKGGGGGRPSRRKTLLTKGQGINLAYLAEAMKSLRRASQVVLNLPIEGALKHATGKVDTLMFDAVAEAAIVNTLTQFNERCAVFTEEMDRRGLVDYAHAVCYFVDPFDRSSVFAERIREAGDEATIVADLLGSPELNMEGVEAPFCSVTCVRESRIIFNVMLDYASGEIYVACEDMLKHGNAEECPDPFALAAYGDDITFEYEQGGGAVCFLGRTGSPARELYEDLYRSGLDFGSMKVLKDDPGGPARVLYLSGLDEGPMPDFVLSNGEKICEWLGWLAYALFSKELAVFELWAEKLSARDSILLAPPPNYSVFVSSRSEGFELDLDRITLFESPSRYRGAIAVTHLENSGMIAQLNARPKCRELLPHRV